MEESYFGLKHPFFLGEKGKPILQWLERYRGTHPEAIQQLRVDIDSGGVQEKLRQTTDIEKLLNAPSYWVTTRLLHAIMPSLWRLRTWLRSIFGNIEEKRT
jgi:hypothetical protein